MTQKIKIMEKKQKKCYKYSAISIKADVAVRFRRYSKQFSKSNSEVLHRMLFFLQWNGLDPFGRSVDKIVSALEKDRKQIEYLISIIKNIEKTQTKPTYEVVKSLFEAYCKNNKEVRKEKLYLPNPIIEKEEKTVPKLYHDQMKREFADYKKQCLHLLENIKEVEPTFGKKYLKIEMSLADFYWLKRILKKD